MKELIARWIKRKDPKPEASAAGICRLVSRAVEQGRLPADAGHMIERLLALSDTPLSEVMIPKAQITWVQASDRIAQVVETFLRSGHSRLPVFQDSPDNVVGIIHIKELLRLWGRSGRHLRAVEFIRLPHFFPQRLKVVQALSEFRRLRISIGIVIDEYGLPVGLVTAEDLVEEIVGELRDELDREKRYHRLLADGSYIIEGDMPLEKFAEVFGFQPQSKAHSVGGLIIDHLQRIPAPGEKFQLLNKYWEVLESAPHRLIKLKVSALK